MAASLGSPPIPQTESFHVLRAVLSDRCTKKLANFIYFSLALFSSKVITGSLLHFLIFIIVCVVVSSMTPSCLAFIYLLMTLEPSTYVYISFNLIYSYLWKKRCCSLFSWSAISFWSNLKAKASWSSDTILDRLASKAIDFTTLNYLATDMLESGVF